MVLKCVVARWRVMYLDGVTIIIDIDIFLIFIEILPGQDRYVEHCVSSV
jgi:hypothetical protein